MDNVENLDTLTFQGWLDISNPVNIVSCEKHTSHHTLDSVLSDENGSLVGECCQSNQYNENEI